MKRLSKKEFKHLLTSISCNLNTCDNRHLVTDRTFISLVWKAIACAALLDYNCQDDLDYFLMIDNKLSNLCSTIN